MSIYQDWIEAKGAEAQAIERRRELEDQMVMVLEIAEDLEGTKTLKDGDYTVKVVGRLNRSVNSDTLQELAAEHGLTEHLSHLFRWKPEINMTLWKAADATITSALAGAITTKPGRPSFNITKKGA
jgi:hypothetical protein